MPPSNKINIKLFGKVCHYILVKHITDTPLTLLILWYLSLWISPQQITEQTLVRDVRWPLYHLNVSIVCKLLRKPTMHTKDLVVDESRHGELLEHTDELFEQAAVLLVVALEGHFGLAFPL